VAMTHEKENHEPNLEFGGAFGPGPRETVADLLRRARQDFGQSLRNVAEVLRIRPAYLEALESGDFDKLPGMTYAIGFLRTYAEYLSLDGEEMVERYKAETQAAAHRSELIFPEPVAEGRIPGGAIILVSVVLLAVAYGGWFYLSQQGRTVADLIPAWPTESQTGELEGAGNVQANAEPAEDASVQEVGAQETGAQETGAEDASAEDTGIVTTASAQASTVSPAEAESLAPVAATPEIPVRETPTLETPAPEALAPEASAPESLASAVPPPSQASETLEVAPTTPTPVHDEPAQTAASPEPQADATPASTPSGAASQESANEAAGEATTFASLIDQTVVIPAVPSTPETVIIPDDRSPRVYGGSNEDSRIIIRALQDSWVQVRDAQEAILLTRVLRAGDSYRVPDVTGLTLLTGNAGGIELEVDGVRLPPAGPAGSVRRSIDLNPAQLLNATTSNR